MTSVRTIAKSKVMRKAGKQRVGRGFSRGELREAGSSLKEAVRLGLPVDDRRKTVHQENIECVKTCLSERKPASKPDRKERKAKD